MSFFRRVALKALSAPRVVIPQSRSIITITPRQTIQSRTQWVVPSFQRRFASDEAAKTNDGKTNETAAEVSAEEPKGAAMADLAAQPDQGVVVEPVSQTEAQTVLGEANNPPGRRKSTGQPVYTPEEATTLYVGNLFFEVSESQLEQRFEQYGKIKKTTIIYDQRGLSKGFGYVEFENPEDAQKAIRDSDQDVFHGRRLAVQQHRKRERPARKVASSNDPAKTLFIGNMSYEMSDKDLNDLFRQVKGVIDVRVAIDRNTGQPRGFAHADFVDIEAATQAKTYLENKEIYGRRLRVDYSLSSAGVRRT